MLQVAPFAPHRPTALGEGQMGNSLVRQAMVNEMDLVKHRMTAIRGYVYHDVNNKLSPAVDKLMKKGQPLDLFAADISMVLPSVRSVSTLLKASRLWSHDPCPNPQPPPPTMSPPQLPPITFCQTRQSTCGALPQINAPQAMFPNALMLFPL